MSVCVCVCVRVRARVCACVCTCTVHNIIIHVHDCIMLVVVYTHLEVVVHGDGHLEPSVVRGLHDDVVRDVVWPQHQAEGEQGMLLLGLASWR